MTSDKCPKCDSNMTTVGCMKDGAIKYCESCLDNGHCYIQSYEPNEGDEMTPLKDAAHD